MDLVKQALYHDRVEEARSIPDEHKENLIKTLYECSSSLPKQRTKEWYDNRKYTFGGSEMSLFTGKNPFNTLYKAVRDKIFPYIKKYTNMYMAFGTLIEPTTVRFIEQLYNTKIYDFSSLPGIIPGTSYSPDGISIVVQNGRKYIVLWEFKAPLSSIPDGKIPPYYLSQIKAGLCTIPWIDKSIFVNMSYRFCTLSQCKYNTDYSIEFHTSDTKKNFKPTTVSGIGVLVFYKTEECEPFNHFEEFYLASNEERDEEQRAESYEEWLYGDSERAFPYAVLYNNEYDLVQSDRENWCIKNMLEYTAEKKIGVFHSKVLIPFSNVAVDDLSVQEYIYDQVCAARRQLGKIIGVICFKILKTDLIEVENEEPNWIYNYREKITNAVQLISSVNELEEEKKLTALSVAFPEDFARDNIEEWFIYEESPAEEYDLGTDALAQLVI